MGLDDGAFDGSAAGATATFKARAAPPSTRAGGGGGGKSHPLSDVMNIRASKRGELEKAVRQNKAAAEEERRRTSQLRKSLMHKALPVPPHVSRTQQPPASTQPDRHTPTPRTRSASAHMFVR